MEYENHYNENKYSTRAVGGTALGIGIGALGLELLRGGAGGLLNVNGGACGCNEDHYVNRYEASQNAKIADLESRNRLLESNIYTDAKIADVYERLNAKIAGVEAQLGQQAVYNATNTATLNCISGQVAQLMALTKVVIPIASICPTPAVATTTTTT